MDARDAIALLAPAMPADGAPPGGAAWADLGAGRGTFTRALAALLARAGGGHVYAVDRDPSAVGAMERALGGAAGITVRHGDFAAPDAARALALPPLDGVLLANALHFVPSAEQPAVLARLARLLRPAGRIVVVEYEARPPSRWVPYPVSPERLAAIVPTGMTAPARAGTRPSAYGGAMYVAWSARAGIND